jgi:hypothetical protein
MTARSGPRLAIVLDSIHLDEHFVQVPFRSELNLLLPQAGSVAEPNFWHHSRTVSYVTGTPRFAIVSSMFL